MDFKPNDVLGTSIDYLEARVLDSSHNLVRQNNVEWHRLLKCKRDFEQKEDQLFVSKEKIMHLKEVDAKNENYMNSTEKSVENLKLSTAQLKSKLNNLKKEKEKVAKDCNEQEQYMREKIVFYEDMWRKRYEEKYSADPKLNEKQGKINQLDELKRKMLTLYEHETKHEKYLFQAKCRRNEGYYKEGNELYPFDTFVVNIAKMYVEAKKVYDECETFSGQIEGIDNRFKLHKSKRQDSKKCENMLHSKDTIKISNNSVLAEPPIVTSLNAVNVPNEVTGQDEPYTLKETNIESHAPMETENELESYNETTASNNETNVKSSSSSRELINPNSTPKTAETAPGYSLSREILPGKSTVRKWMERLQIYVPVFQTTPEDTSAKSVRDNEKTESKPLMKMDTHKNINREFFGTKVAQNRDSQENNKIELSSRKIKDTPSDLKPSFCVNTLKHFRKIGTDIPLNTCDIRNTEMQRNSTIHFFPKKVTDASTETIPKNIECSNKVSNSDLKNQTSSMIITPRDKTVTIPTKQATFEDSSENVTLKKPSSGITSKYFNKNDSEFLKNTLQKTSNEVSKEKKNFWGSDIPTEQKCGAPHAINREERSKENVTDNRNYLHRKVHKPDETMDIDGQLTKNEFDCSKQNVKEFETVKTGTKIAANSTLENANDITDINNSPLQHTELTEINNSTIHTGTAFDVNKDIGDEYQDTTENINAGLLDIEMVDDINKVYNKMCNITAPAQGKTKLPNESYGQPDSHSSQDTKMSMEIENESDNTCGEIGVDAENYNEVVASKETFVESESNLSINSVSPRDELILNLKQAVASCKITETIFKTPITADLNPKTSLRQLPNTEETYADMNIAENISSSHQGSTSSGFAYTVRQMYERNSANGTNYSTLNIPNGTLLSQLAFFNNTSSPTTEFTQVDSPDEEKSDFLSSVYENFLTDSPPLSKTERSMFSFAEGSPPENEDKNDFFPLFAARTGEASQDAKDGRAQFMFNFGNGSQVKSPEESNGFKLLF